MSNHTIHTRSKTFLAVQAALTTLALATPVTDAMAVSGSSVNVSTIAVADIPENSAYGVASGSTSHSGSYQAVSGGSAWDPITGNVGGAFIGGGSANSSGGASGNSATVTGTPNSGSESGYYSVVAGGAFQSGDNEVIDNVAIVSAGTIGTVIGGFQGVNSGTSAVSGNTATLLKGEIVSGANSKGGDLVGAIAYGSGNTVALNSAVVSGGTVRGNVIGGWAKDGGVATTSNVTSNVAIVAGGSVGGSVIGGYVENTSGAGGAVANSAIVGGGTVGGSVIGGRALTSAGATSNVAIVSGGNVGGAVIGGFADNSLGAGGAVGNSAIVSAAKITLSDSVLGGVVNTSGGAATSNVVTIAVSGLGGITGDIAGGYVQYGDGSATANSATITNSRAGAGHVFTLEGGLFGGYAVSGGATSNALAISGNVTYSEAESESDEYLFGVYGGYAGAGAATSNTVTLQGGFQTEASVIGGYSDDDSGATGNKVVISGQVEVGNVYGGVGNSGGSASENTVNISGQANITGNITGGYVKGEGAASSNVVEIVLSGGAIEGGISGGYVEGEGDVIANSATISNTDSKKQLDIVYNIAGGATVSGAATSNVVTIGGNIAQSGEGEVLVFGGYTESGDVESNTVTLQEGFRTTGKVAGGFTSSGGATSNTLNLSGAVISVGGSVAGGVTYSGGEANENQVNISAGSGGTIGGLIYGGYAESGASGNSAVIENAGAGTKNALYLAGSGVAGGYTGSGDATSNVLSISGNVVTVEDAILLYGGYTGDGGDATGNKVTLEGGFETAGTVFGGYSRDEDATENTVTISGAVKASAVYGGYAGGSGETTSNIVNINITSGASLGGVYGGNNNSYEGNTLNLSSVAAGASIGTVGGFETVEFLYSGNANIDVLEAESEDAVNLNVSAGATITFGGQIVGGGDLALNSAGALLVTGSLRDELDGDKTYSGGIAINSGALQFQGQTQELTGDITGSAGTFLQIGGGSSGTNTELILAGDNDAYSGTLNVISGGTLSIGSDENIGAGSNVLSGGGTLKLTGDSYSKAWTISGAGNTIAPENDVVFSGALSGVSGVGLIVTGDGELTLAVNNSASYSGNITVQDGGKLAIANDNNLGASGVGTYTLDDGTLILTGATYSADWTLDNSSTENIIEARYTSDVISFGGLLTGSGGLTIAGSGTLNFTNTSNAGKVTGDALITDGATLLLTADTSGNIADIYTSGSDRVLEGGTLEFDLTSARSGVGIYKAEWEIQGSTDEGEPTENAIKVAGSSGVLNLTGDYSLVSGSANYATLSFDSDKGSDGSQALIVVKGGIKNTEALNVEVKTPLYLTNTSDGVYGYTTTTVNSTGTATAQDPLTSATVSGGQKWEGLNLASGVTLTNDVVVLKNGAKVTGTGSSAEDATHRVTGTVDVQGTNVIYSGGITLDANGATVVLPDVSSGSLGSSGYVLGFVNSAVGNFEGAKFDFDKVSDEALGQVFYTSVGGQISGLEKASGYSGYLTEYVFTAPEASGGYAGVDKKAAEQTKSLSEGFLGGITLLGLGSDLVTDNGIRSAASSVARSGGTGEAFAALGGGRLKHKTGSHVEVSGFNLMAGLAAGVGNGVTVGAFFEYGDGDYDSSNSFSRKVKGSGDVDYAGVGFLGRLDLPKTASGQPYLEATARFGRVKSDFKSDDFLSGNVSGTAKYDVKSNYHGLSFGGGHVWNLGGNSAVDLYGRYVWTRQAGDSAKVKIGGNNEGTVKFSDVDSHRLRVGLRYSNAWSGSNRFYAGAAWEHEFDGEAGARIVDVGKIDDSPDLKGSTGIAEFGFVFNPDRKNLFIDLGIQGYGGKRSGVTGSAQLKYLF